MFRTSSVYHQEDYIVHAALYGMFFMHLCKLSSKSSDVNISVTLRLLISYIYIYIYIYFFLILSMLHHPEVRHYIQYTYIYIYIYIYDIRSPRINDVTLILLTWRKW